MPGAHTVRPTKALLSLATEVQHCVPPSHAQQRPGPSWIPPELGLHSTNKAELLLCELELVTDHLWASPCCSSAPQLKLGRAEWKVDPISPRASAARMGPGRDGAAQPASLPGAHWPGHSSVVMDRQIPQGLPPHQRTGRRREEAATQEPQRRKSPLSPPTPRLTCANCTSQHRLTTESTTMAPQDSGAPRLCPAPPPQLPWSGPLQFPFPCTASGAMDTPGTTGPCPSQRQDLRQPPKPDGGAGWDLQWPMGSHCPLGP